MKVRWSQSGFSWEWVEMRVRWSRTKASFSHLQLSGFERSFARKLRFHTLKLQFNAAMSFCWLSLFLASLIFLAQFLSKAFKIVLCSALAQRSGFGAGFGQGSFYLANVILLVSATWCLQIACCVTVALHCWWRSFQHHSWLRHWLWMFCWLHEACSQGWAGTIMTGEGFHTAGKAGLREKVHVRQADQQSLDFIPSFFRSLSTKAFSANKRRLPLTMNRRTYAHVGLSHLPGP